MARAAQDGFVRDEAGSVAKTEAFVAGNAHACGGKRSQVGLRLAYEELYGDPSVN